MFVLKREIIKKKGNSYHGRFVDIDFKLIDNEPDWYKIGHVTDKPLVGLPC